MFLGLLGLAAGAPFLFGVPDEDVPRAASTRNEEESTVGGVASIYANLFTAASACRPEEVSSAPGGHESVPDLAAAVEQLRDLEFTKDPEVEFMSAEALAAHVGSVQRSMRRPEIEAEFEALETLAVVPENFDIDEFRDASSQQVLGLYKPGSGRLLVAGSGVLSRRTQVIVAHELDHALTDQVLGFPPRRSNPPRADALFAESALIEGDATLLMQHYALVEFPSRLRQVFGGGSPEQRRQLAEMPHFLRRAAGFPYQEGFLWTCELYKGGGWHAVDDAYSSPPASTLEILFPDLYGEIDVEIPITPGSPGPEWSKVSSVALGAADLQWMFEAPGGVFGGDTTEPANQVSRWRGGRFHIWEKDGRQTIAMAIVEGPDLSGSAPLTLCHRLVRWYADSFPTAEFIPGGGAAGAWRNGSDYAMVHCDDEHTRLVVAPDLSTATGVAQF